MILDYIDTSLFQPVYNGQLPTITSPNMVLMANEIHRAIVSNRHIFIYGDYDMDGLCSMLMWKEVFNSLRYKNISFFSYKKRTHHIDKNIIYQVPNNALVIINDTGSSLKDIASIDILTSRGCQCLIIDHHEFGRSYSHSFNNFNFQPIYFNSFEEKSNLKGGSACGAYSALMIAKILCEDFCVEALPYGARVYALAAMYADGIDLSTEIGRALYNNVIYFKGNLPKVIEKFNRWDYRLSRRLFSYIISPKINACFRSEAFAPLNGLISSESDAQFDATLKKIDNIYSISRGLVDTFIDDFSIETHGNFCLAIASPTEKLLEGHAQNFTGLIAQNISNRTKRPTVAVIANIYPSGVVYKGSYRDYLSRPAKHLCVQIMDMAAGHSAAFGVEFRDINAVRYGLQSFADTILKEQVDNFVTLSTTLIKDISDINALALYNEYMTVKPQILLSNRFNKVMFIRGSKWSKIYDLGLPKMVKSSETLVSGSTIRLEPCITREVELRVSTS